MHIFPLGVIGVMYMFTLLGYLVRAMQASRRQRGSGEVKTSWTELLLGYGALVV